MEKRCVCGKEIDERINYCVHCGKELKKVEVKETTTKRRPKSKKYSPLLDILKG